MDQTTPKPPLTLGDEIDAIRDVTKAVDRLDTAAAMRVCEFVLKRKGEAKTKPMAVDLRDDARAPLGALEQDIIRLVSTSRGTISIAESDALVASALKPCDCPICTAARERGEQKPMR